MRVSDANSHASFQRNLYTSQKRLNKLSYQLGTFTEINKSSDDPLAFSKILGMNQAIVKNEGYNKTINESISWCNTQDAALDSATESMHRIRDLMILSANDTTTEEDMEINKQEMISEIESIVDSLNATYDGRYVFGGQNTDIPPFEVIKDDKGDITEIKYHGTPDNLPREVSGGITVDLTTNGSIFANSTTDADGNTGNVNTFIQELMTAMNNNDKEALSGTAATGDQPATGLLVKMDSHINNIVNTRAKIGTTSNRLDKVKERNEAENLQLREDLSEKQDIDVVEKYIEFSNQMLSYEASMKIGTKILQTSILDYV